MSIATLKKKTKNSYKVVSGKKSNKGFALNHRLVNNNEVITYGGGFSLNGSNNQNNYISQNLGRQLTIGPYAKMVCEDSHGGQDIAYVGQTDAHPNTKLGNCYPCNALYVSSPSVMNTRGLLSRRKQKYTNHLNVVQNISNADSNSQGVYIQNTKNTKNMCLGDVVCYPDKKVRNLDSDEYLKRLKHRKALLPTLQYVEHYPPPINHHSKISCGEHTDIPLSEKEFMKQQMIIRKKQQEHCKDVNKKCVFSSTPQRR